MYLNNVIIFDTESNGFLDQATKIHCIVTYKDGDGYKKWHNSTLLERDGDIQDGVNYLNTGTICGHNISGHDLPLLNKLGYKVTSKYYDSFILSQMLFPNERQSHGLAEWGKVFNVAKPAQEQWDVFNAEMLHRCTEDTKINKLLVDELAKELNKDNWNWDKSVKLEHDVYKVYVEQGTKWLMDKEKLLEKYQRYIELQESLELNLSLLRKPLVIPGKECKYLTKSKQVTAKAILLKAEGDFCKVEFKLFDPASVKQMTEHLVSMGWRPTQFTPKGSPSLRDDPLIGLPEDLKLQITEYRDVIHRVGVLKGFIERIQDNNEINMFAYTCGTNTARFRHAGVVNIQPEFKDLFIAHEGRQLIGCDASQLEARIEGHFTSKYDKGAYAKYLLEMDVHQFNADMWGVTRSEAKAPFYAMAYGCGATKLATMLKVSEERAQEIIKMHYETWPGLVALIQEIESCIRHRGFLKPGKKGRSELDESIKPWIKGIDGRKLYIRGMHKLKNTLIQSSGSIAMKWAYVRLAELIKQYSLDAKIVMFYHDEFVVEIKSDENQINLLTKLTEQAIVEAGDHFKFRIPLKGEAKVGTSWKEVK